MLKKIAVVLLAVACAALVLGAVGCGKTKGNPEQTITDFWNALKKGDISGAMKYISKDLPTPESLESLEGADSSEKEMITAMLKSMSLVPVSSEVSGDTAVVQAELTAPNIDEITDKLMAMATEMMSSGLDIASMTEEELDELFMKEFMKLLDEGPTTTYDEDIDMVWEDDMWKIDSNPFSALESGMDLEGM